MVSVATFGESTLSEGPVQRTGTTPISAQDATTVRSAVIEVPLWETAMAMGLMVIAAAGVLLLGGRIYQRAVLRMGARVRLREAFGSVA